jgi:hypothetical protein
MPTLPQPPGVPTDRARDRGRGRDAMAVTVPIVQRAVPCDRMFVEQQFDLVNAWRARVVVCASTLIAAQRRCRQAQCCCQSQC